LVIKIAPDDQFLPHFYFLKTSNDDITVASGLKKGIQAFDDFLVVQRVLEPEVDPVDVIMVVVPSGERQIPGFPSNLSFCHGVSYRARWM
jgi:hypothetical protein